MNEEHFTFHLQYKHSGTFANRKYEELSYPKKSEYVRPHSRMRPHYSQSSRENKTPSSGTYPLAPYKEEPPPRGGGGGGELQVTVGSEQFVRRGSRR